MSLTPERERGHGHVVEFDDVWFPPSSPSAITTTASPRFSKKQLFAVVTVLSAAVVLVAVLSHSIKNDGKLGRIGSFQAASIDDGSSNGQNVVNIYPDIFPNKGGDEIEADANLSLLDLGEIFLLTVIHLFPGKSVPVSFAMIVFCLDWPPEHTCRKRYSNGTEPSFFSCISSISFQLAH